MDRSRPASWLLVAAFATSGAAGCAPPAISRDGAVPKRADGAPREAAQADPNAEAYVWQATTESPRAAAAPLAQPDPCGSAEGALLAVARRIADRDARGDPPLELAEVAFALRSEGSPYVWPRTWTLVGPDAVESSKARLAAWLASLPDEGERRCAVATARSGDGRDAVAAVAVGVLADLSPLPTRTRVGAWLELRAELLVAATRVQVLVLGPRGRPRAALASFAGGEARARFHVDREGTWLVQLLATTASGPRPVAEALVTAGGEPPRRFAAAKAPGELSSIAGQEPRDALAAMVNAARASENLGALRRDERLDRLALEHAEAMRAAGRLAHDLGGGGVAERVGSLTLRAAGENVAHAVDLARAHRALWASPSHRENLLHPSYEIVGIGVAPGENGSVWVAEIFADPD